MSPAVDLNEAIKVDHHNVVDDKQILGIVTRKKITEIKKNTESFEICALKVSTTEHHFNFVEDLIKKQTKVNDWLTVKWVFRKGTKG